MHGKNAIELTARDHATPADGLCFMEAIALFAGERHGDWPSCVCPALIEVGRVINDIIPDCWRTQLLMPLVPVLIGTCDAGSNGDAFRATAGEIARSRAWVAWATEFIALINLQSVSHRAVSAEVSQVQYKAAAAIEEATEQLSIGQAQHAARWAARAVAWSARGLGRSERKLLTSDLSGDAILALKSTQELAAWTAIVAAFRRIALDAGAERTSEKPELAHA